MKIIFTLLIGLFSVCVFAQEAVTTGTTATSVQSAKTEEAPDAKEVKTLKKIEITGSYIKRVDEEGPTPVQTISNETLKKSGYNSVADVLRDAAVISSESREDSLSGSPGTATAGIGAFGSESILVLLDGNRLPKIGGSNAVDLNMIPVGALERVEVLKDGASAIYGSDAIGGVMNFITKKDYDGGSVSLGQSASQAGGAGKTDFTGSFGKKFKKGSISGIYQYRQNDHLADKDRDYTRVVDMPRQASYTSQQGSFSGTDGLQYSPNCPEDQKFVDTDGSVYCLFDYTKYSWNMPNLTQNSMMVAGNYRVNEYLNSRTQVTGTYRVVNTRLAPAPASGRNTVRINPAIMNQYLTALGLPTTNVDQVDPTAVNFRIAEGGGTRDSDDVTFGYTAAQTFDGKITGSWNYNITGSYSSSDNKQDKRGYADKVAFEKLINSGNYNVFAPAGQKGDFTSALINPFTKTTSAQSEIRAVANGQLYDGSESFGPIAMAVGSSANWQSYEETADAITLAGNTLGDAASSGQGKRNYQAVFSEISIFPIQSLEVDLAARYDQYSDFGNTVNPKLALSWQATDKVMVRSSVGTGFRAPNLDSLYGGASLGYPSFSDVVQCATKGTGCSARQYEMSTFSNPNLKEETSIFYNAGILLQPKKNWNVETNFFLARVEDNVGGVSGADVMRGELAYGIQGMKDRFNVEIIRDSAGRLVNITMPGAFNTAFGNTSGIDFRITNASKFNVASIPFDVVFNMDHIQYLTEESEVFAGTGVQNSRDVNWKNNVSVTAGRGHHSLRVGMRSISGGDKSGNGDEIGVVGQGSLRAHTEYDLNYTWDEVFKKTALNVGVKNVFDAARPLDDTAQSQLASGIYDPIGRYFYSNIAYTF